MSAKEIKFPEGFLWGTAVCSHQVEGHNEHSDWWAWEQIPGKITDGSVSGPACDMLHRYPEDFAFMEKLGLNSFRFSIEWARIEPRKGQYSEEAILHYENVLKELHKRGIKPCVTLYHWVLPKWMADEGGWTNSQSVKWFGDYVRLVIDRLAPYIDIWCTLNEPMVPVLASYLGGVFPPEKKDPILAGKVFKNLLRVHGNAYHDIMKSAEQRGVRARTEVGIAMAVADVVPIHPENPIDKGLHRALRYCHNTAFIDAIETGKVPLPFGLYEVIPGLAKTQTYVGVNYYTRFRVEFPPKFGAQIGFSSLALDPDTEKTEMGYEVYPQGFYNVIMDAATRYGRPVYILENGIADVTDNQRPSYILRHLAQIDRAMKDGADVRGYFHWSFIDNFEWKEGYRTKFGLVAYDPQTFERTPRKSAFMYGEIAKSGRITDALIAEYAPHAADEVWNPKKS